MKTETAGSREIAILHHCPAKTVHGFRWKCPAGCPCYAEHQKGHYKCFQGVVSGGVWNRNFMDHAEARQDENGDRTVVSYLYDLELDDLSWLFNYCRVNRLCLHLRGGEKYGPGTCELRFYAK